MEDGVLISDEFTNPIKRRAMMEKRMRKAAGIEAAVPPPILQGARDADVTQTYVRLGLGVGIVAHMAVDEGDPDLAAIEAAHLFAAHTTWIGFRRGTLLRKYMYDFAQLLAPHLERRVVERAHRASSAEEVAALFADTALPLR